MKQLDTQLAVAICALSTLTLGILVVAGAGWALIVSSVLVLAYVIIPDQSPGGPTS